MFPNFLNDPNDYQQAKTLWRSVGKNQRAVSDRKGYG